MIYLVVASDGKFDLPIRLFKCWMNAKKFAEVGARSCSLIQGILDDRGTHLSFNFDHATVSIVTYDEDLIIKTWEVVVA